MAAELKAKGTEAFQKKEYDEAIKLYGQAIELSKSDHLLYSNRSAAYAGAGKYEEALVDAQKCLELKPDFAKGYGRMGLAQYHLNKPWDAKKSYEEGLKYDSESKVLKEGIRDAKKKLRPWFLSVLAEATAVQRVVQDKLCEAIHQSVSAGTTCLSFPEAHGKVVELSLPSDTLEKYGISEEEFGQTIEEYEKAYDYEVLAAFQQMCAPDDRAFSQESSKVEISTLVEVHKFMESQMRKIVDEFTQLPAEIKQSIPQKERERTAEFLVSVSVESSFKIKTEDLEAAVGCKHEQLQAVPEFVECQGQLSSLLQQLREEPFIEKAPDKASTLTASVAEGSVAEGSKGNPVASSQTGTIACAVGTVSVLTVAMLLISIRWRARGK